MNYFGVLQFLLLLRTSTSSLEVWNHLSTRTPYRFIENSDDTELVFQGCSAKKIWQYSRHGSRYPGSGPTQNFIEQLPSLRDEIVLNYQLERGDLTADEVQQFQQWELNVTSADAGELHEEGGREHLALGRRTLNRFRSIVPAVFNNDSIIFRSSASTRAAESAVYFSRGIYDQDVWMPPTEDEVVRWYNYCDKYQTEIYSNPDTYKERDLYGQNAEMLQAIAAVSRRIGFNVTFETAYLTYLACGFETAWTLDYISPWCNLLDSSSAEAMEYYDDLDNYWSNGYGYELTYKQACLVLEDMFQFLSSNTNRTANLLFGHSGGVLKILSLLGLYEPETHLNGTIRNAGRTFKTSQIDSFASNIAFVLYDCNEEEFVATLHQERVVRLPYCDSELCPLQTLREHFYDAIHHCHFSEMCEIVNSATHVSSVAAINALIVFLFYLLH